MKHSFNRLLSSLALATQLCFGSATIATAKDHRTPIPKIAIDPEENLEGKVTDPHSLPIYFNWDLFYLNPSALPTPKNSMLSLVNLDDLAVSTLGLSVDCFIFSKDLQHDWQGTLPFGIFFDFSSTHLFQTSINNSGLVKYKEIAAGYKIKGDMNYFAIGLTLNPAAFYQKGPFVVGVALEMKGGLTFLTSNNQIDIGLTDSVIRGLAKNEGISPDAKGSINVYGFGGFGQFLVGPTVGIYDVTCFGGVGLRYDAMTLRVQEHVDNRTLMSQLHGDFKTDYNRASVTYGVKCGYRF